MKTIVVFRKWKSLGNVIALFPEIAADIDGFYCGAFEHIGQHGAADYHHVIRRTVPASKQEITQLTKELKLRGYRLAPVLRATQQHHARRRAAAVEMRTT